MNDYIEDLSESQELIITMIDPVLRPMAVALKGHAIERGAVGLFVRNANENPRDLSDVVTIIKGFMDNTKREIEILKGFISKNERKIKVNPTQQEVIERTIENVNNGIFFSSELLTSMFVDFNSIPKTKRNRMIEGVDTYVKIYNGINNGGIIDEVSDVTAGVPIDVLSGFTAGNTLPFISGFVGNPFYHWGIRSNNRKVRRAKVLEDRIKYIRLEIMELEMKGDGGDSSRHIKDEIQYYKDKIIDAEMEIEDLEK